MNAQAVDFEVARFFRDSYIRWAVGMLDPEDVQDLDELSPAGWENWKDIMQRETGHDAGHFRQLQLLLCKTADLSRDEALEVMLRSE